MGLGEPERPARAGDRGRLAVRAQSGDLTDRPGGGHPADRIRPQRALREPHGAVGPVFFFKQKTAYEIGLGIPAEPLFRSTLILNTFLFGVIILIANILKRAFSSQLAAKLRNRLLVL